MLSGAPWVGRTIYERAVMLDTGPLISLYDPSDEQRKDVIATLGQVQSQKYPICITSLTIAETHNRILYDINEECASKFLRNIYDGSVNVLETQPADTLQAMAIIEKYHGQKITWTDAVCMAIMKRMGIRKVMSYDYHFWIMNFTVLP